MSDGPMVPLEKTVTLARWALARGFTIGWESHSYEHLDVGDAVEKLFDVWAEANRQASEDVVEDTLSVRSWVTHDGSIFLATHAPDGWYLYFASRELGFGFYLLDDIPEGWTVGDVIQTIETRKGET